MRVLSKDIQQAIAEFQGFTYCFQIKLLDGTCLHLTESDKTIIWQNTLFSPSSGLSFIKAEFNDSAQNYIILEGIFEAGGITCLMDLNGAEIQIFLFFPNLFYHFITYYVTSYTKHDLSFNLRLQPITDRYNQSVLQSFSKTCRASFGDSKCKADKASYSRLYNIAEISGKTIMLENIDKDNGYYNLGTASIVDHQFEATIFSHTGNTITLDRMIPASIQLHKAVMLFPGCDKHFITCCEKFNNSINFRGEPFIPEKNVIKISTQIN